MNRVVEAQEWERQEVLSRGKSILSYCTGQALRCFRDGCFHFSLSLPPSPLLSVPLSLSLSLSFSSFSLLFSLFFFRRFLFLSFSFYVMELSKSNRDKQKQQQRTRANMTSHTSASSKNSNNKNHCIAMRLWLAVHAIPLIESHMHETDTWQNWHIKITPFSSLCPEVSPPPPPTYTLPPRVRTRSLSLSLSLSHTHTHTHTHTRTYARVRARTHTRTQFQEKSPFCIFTNHLRNQTLSRPGKIGRAVLFLFLKLGRAGLMQDCRVCNSDDCSSKPTHPPNQPPSLFHFFFVPIQSTIFLSFPAMNI